jgi:hypothetical protein
MSSFLAKRPAPTTSQKIPLVLRFGFWGCMVIGVAVVIRRVIALANPEGSASVPPEMRKLDSWFQAHATLTYAHILLALVFLCFLPFMFWSRTAQSKLVRSAFYALGAAVALTAYGMSRFSVGGWVERAAVLFFNTLFLGSLCLSLRAWSAGDAQAERRWTLRSVATVLGIATTRPVMGVFFATSRFTHWTPQQFFGPAFWIGFSINVVAVELWLRREERSFL